MYLEYISSWFRCRIIQSVIGDSIAYFHMYFCSQTQLIFANIYNSREREKERGIVLFRKETKFPTKHLGIPCIFYISTFMDIG